MKKHTIAFAFLLAVAFGAAPLSAQFFTKYVALGDSLTAGFQSGCLVQRNQLTSFPAVLARTLDVPDFQQPLVQEVAVTDPPGTTCLFPAVVNGAITVTPQSQMGDPLNALLQRPYDNLGLPGFNVADLTEFRHSNPFGDSKNRIGALVLRNIPGFPLDGTNAVDQANILLGPASPPTFVTLWIGNNDVLGAATSGIVVDGVTLTTAADFEASYQAILDGLLPSTRFVGATIPDVTAIPFTTTIPRFLVDPATQQPILVEGQPVPLLGEGDDAFPCVLGGGGQDLGCPLPEGTLVNLPASALLARGIGIPVAAGGTGLPLPHGHIDASGAHAGVVLYPDEVQKLQARTNEYNASIAAALGSRTLWDAHGFFDQIRAQGGYSIGGVTVTTAFIKGGLFSYDGVHPSNIGYMVVADQIIGALNSEGDVVYPRPNFSAALFTPNVPPTVATAEEGGAWGYTLSTWRGVLDRFASSLGPVEIPEAPRVSKPLHRDGGTRSVVRGSGG